MKKNYLIGGLIVLAIIIVGIIYAQQNQKKNLTNQEASHMPTLKLTSSAFEQNGTIPAEFTCQGKGTNPPLTISGVPEGTVSLALILDDPDAPTPAHVFDHWVMWNISPTTTEILVDSVPAGAILGKNGTGTAKYYPPCPPTGTHHYNFTLAALNKPIDLKAGSTKTQLLDAIKDKVIESFKLTGLYQKS